MAMVIKKITQSTSANGLAFIVFIIAFIASMLISISG